MNLLGTPVGSSFGLPAFAILIWYLLNSFVQDRIAYCMRLFSIYNIGSGWE
jgi:hypothetical protein